MSDVCLVRRWTDCFGDGCAECDVCKYLDFIEYAESCCPPSEGIITRNRELDAYLELSEEAQRALPLIPACDETAAWNAALEAALRTLPGGTSCDPQQVADAIRELMLPEEET